MLEGLIVPAVVGYIVVALVFTHITIAASQSFCTAIRRIVHSICHR